MLEMQRTQNAAAGLLRRRFKRLDCHYSVDVMMQVPDDSSAHSVLRL